MFHKFNLNYFHLILIGATGFGSSVLVDTFWPMITGILLCALLLLLHNPKDEYTFKADVTATFSEQGYVIIKERHLNFLERMNRDPEVQVSALSFNEITPHAKEVPEKILPGIHSAQPGP